MGPRRRGSVGGGREEHCPPQPRRLHPRRAHRVLGVVGVVGDGAVHAHGGLPHRCRRKVLPRRRTHTGRSSSTPAVHLRHRHIRWPQLDHHQRTGPGGADDPDPVLHLEARDLLHHVHDRRRIRRTRRRELRLLDDQHQRVLPATPQGLGPGFERGRREHRRPGHPVDRPARYRHLGQPQPADRLRGVPGAHRHRRRHRGPLHGQPHRPEDRRTIVDRCTQVPRLLDHLVSLHRNIRIVHRIQLRLRPDPATELPRRTHQRRSGDRRHAGHRRPARRPDRLHRTAPRVPVPPTRWPPRRQDRRRQDHPLQLRGDDGSRRDSRRRRHRRRLHPRGPRTPPS